MKSLIIAFAMYSKVPMPRVDWEKKALRVDWEKKALSWALCFFPLVGVVIGAVLYGWMALARYLGFGPLFFAAFALLIPIALSGGIHLDGFCDTCDALSSHQRAQAGDFEGLPHRSLRHHLLRALPAGVLRLLE